jgi:HD-GYP domain-containing protein (c-di-GMP phosphodiesterase class II)
MLEPAVFERRLRELWGLHLLHCRPPACEPDLLARMGEAARKSLSAGANGRSREQELRQLAAELAQSYEEISLLYELTRRAQVTREPSELQLLALESLADILPVEQVAYVSAGSEPLWAGRQLLAAEELALLAELIPFPDSGTARPYVNNSCSEAEWCRPIPQVERLVAVSIRDCDGSSGVLLAANSPAGPLLGSVEASLMSAVAAILATHESNRRLLEETEELFLGVVRALASAIDAKDPYTRGHSERVARVARRLGKEMGLSEADCDVLYLAGLLHDVGKIGVRDAVLRKPTRLTDDQFDYIKSHPLIGYEILSGVPQLAPVLPGVRSHHESLDGRGYPDGLADDEVPLVARIIAVADAYDAMTSDRCYRKQMDTERVVSIFRRGAGSQWDEQVVELLLKIMPELPQILHDTGDNGSSAAVPVRPIRLHGSALLRPKR